MSVRAPVGRLNMARERCAIGRGVAALRSSSQPSTLFYALAADGSCWEPFETAGTVFGSIGKDQLGGLMFGWPVPAAAGLIEAKLAALDGRLTAAESETATFTALRDTLLPKLLSGEVRVRAAEEVVGDAL